MHASAIQPRSPVVLYGYKCPAATLVIVVILLWTICPGFPPSALPYSCPSIITLSPILYFGVGTEGSGLGSGLGVGFT